MAAAAVPPRVDFSLLVNSAADRFEVRRQMPVTQDGREALIEPAIPYQDRVDKELRRGEITLGRLEDSVTQVLDNGYEIAKTEKRNVIDADVVSRSMKKYCPYIMWC